MSNGVYDSQPAISEAELKKVEHRLGFRFPIQLRSMLLKHDGGRFIKAFYFANDMWNVVHTLLSVDTIESTMSTLVDVGLREGFIPFADDPGGDYYCVDITDGSVYVWRGEYEPDASSAWSQLAPSLTKFVEGMQGEPTSLAAGRT